MSSRAQPLKLSPIPATAWLGCNSYDSETASFPYLLIPGPYRLLPTRHILRWIRDSAVFPFKLTSRFPTLETAGTQPRCRPEMACQPCWQNQRQLVSGREDPGNRTLLTF